MAKEQAKDKLKKANNRLKAPNNRKKANQIFWLIFLSPIVLLFLLLLSILIGVFGALPSFEELENPRSNLATQVISSDGVNIGSFFVENRSFVDYKDLSPNVVAALVSTEDSRFYKHSGIDFPGLARVAVKTVILQDRGQGGGSTISQQLAKNLYPRDTIHNGTIVKAGKLAINKLKEWITAVMLEYNYTKEEIVAMYLNTVEYGSNAYGIKSAAMTFFSKQPSELNIEEAAMLVGVVNAPTRYSPIRNPQSALKRRNLVLGRMASAGYITEDQATKLQAKPIELKYQPLSHNDGIGTYFREMVRQYMNAKEPTRDQFNNDWDYEKDLDRWKSDPLYGWCNKNLKADGNPYNLYKDGLKIYVTVNSKMQRYAEEAVVEQLKNEVQPQFDRERKAYNRLFSGISKKDADNIMKKAVLQSDRGRVLRRAGMGDDEIMAEFRKPVGMTVFSYRGKGEIDTVMTPFDSISYYKAFMRAGFVVVEPATGYVRAFVGGPSFRYFKYDMARQGKRQVGSTVKPFIYTFAMDFLGMTPCTLVPNLRVEIELGGGREPWSPKEAGTVEYDGVLHPLSWGLANSRNNYSAYLMKRSSPEAVVDLIHKMGVTSYIEPVYSVCVGTPEVSVFEMAGAFSTFANRGVNTEPFFVTRIEDKQGNVLASFSPNTHDAISETTAYTMLGMLQNNVASGTGGRLRSQYGMTGEVGGKTGTTNDQADAWFIGVTPKLVGGAWVGGEDRWIHLSGRGDGSAVALPIFGRFMKKVYADKSLGVSNDDKFPPPVGAVRMRCEEGEEGRKARGNNKEHEREFFD